MNAKMFVSMSVTEYLTYFHCNQNMTSHANDTRKHHNQLTKWLNALSCSFTILNLSNNHHKSEVAMAHRQVWTNHLSVAATLLLHQRFSLTLHQILCDVQIITMQYFAKMQLCPVIFITVTLTVYYASIVLWLINFVSAVLSNISQIFLIFLVVFVYCQCQCQPQLLSFKSIIINTDQIWLMILYFW